MRQIGLILEGETAKIFLDSLLQDYYSSNFFTILTQDSNLIPETYPDTFSFACCDPTSKTRLQQTFTQNIDQFFIITTNTQEKQEICQNLRDIFPKIPFFTDSTYSLNLNDSLLHELSIPTIMAHKLITHLPNTPTILQDFGLNKGEIIEVSVPPGSVYCYRQVSSITQKNWKIVGVYRNQELLLNPSSIVIRPNDKLLAIGNPQMLGHIHKQITSSLGQFPIPFGKDIFLFLDERILDENEILQDLDEALFLHKQLNTQQLNIILLNPANTEVLNHLKSLQAPDIDVHIEYMEQKLLPILQRYAQKKIGLAILNHKLFHLPKIKKALLEFEIPTYKTAVFSISECKQGLVFLEDDKIENIASVIFDITSQLNLDFYIYDFDADGNYHLDCLESFQNLSTIFNNPIHLTQNNTQNPINYLSNIQAPTLNFIPLSISSATSSVFKLASTDLSYFLANTNLHPQILIPIPYNESE